MGKYEPVCGRQGNQLQTFHNSGCAEGAGVYFYEDGICDEVFNCGNENDEVSRSQSCIVANVGNGVKINQCVGCTRQFFTKSFLGDDAAVLARSSGGEPSPPRHRAGVAPKA